MSLQHCTWAEQVAPTDKHPVLDVLALVRASALKARSCEGMGLRTR